MQKIKLLRQLVLTAMLPGMLALCGSAYAVAPANTRITNTAELTYTGVVTPIQASVDVLITLAAAAPTLSAPPDNTVAASQSSTFAYTITANANGGDTYNLTNPVFTPSNLAGASTMTFTQGGASVTSITLGASAVNAAFSIGASAITVPSDGSANSSVNDLQAGDTVVIAGNTYVINTVVDDGTSATITLTSPLITALSLGDPIFEQQSFNATIADVGTTTGTPATITTDIAATSQADTSQVATDTTITNVVSVAFEKYVTNESNVNGNSPVAIDLDGDGNADQNFYTTASGVTATTGDVLRYALRVTAPAGTNLTGVQFADVIPAFSTYVAGSTELNGAAVADAVGPTSPLVSGMDVNSPGQAAGTVNAGESAVVTFRITID